MNDDARLSDEQLDALEQAAKAATDSGDFVYVANPERITALVAEARASRAALAPMPTAVAAGVTEQAMAPYTCSEGHKHTPSQRPDGWPCPTTYLNKLESAAYAAQRSTDALTVLSIEAPLKRLRERIAEHGTQKAAAEAAGVSSSYLNDVLHGARTPSGKLLEWLGFLEFGGYVDADEHAAALEGRDQ